MKNKILFLIMLLSILIFLSAPANANLAVQIDVNDVKANDDLAFSYQINSDVDEQIGFFARIECPLLISQPIEIRTIDLKGGVPFEEKRNYGVINENVEPQNCVAVVKIISPIMQIFDKNFGIKTIPTFGLLILVCEDIDCSQRSKVFLKNSRIFLDFEATEEVKATAILTEPGGNTRTLELPANFTPIETGTFGLEVTAENFKTVTKKTEFYVVENKPRVVSKNICDADGVCKVGENSQNCPQDCLSGSADEYCDRIADGKCDPNCQETEDVDCIKEAPMLLEIDWLLAGSIAVITIIIIIVGAFAWQKRKNR